MKSVLLALPVLARASQFVAPGLTARGRWHVRGALQVGAWSVDWDAGLVGAYSPCVAWFATRARGLAELAPEVLSNSQSTAWVMNPRVRNRGAVKTLVITRERTGFRSGGRRPSPRDGGAGHR